METVIYFILVVGHLCLFVWGFMLLKLHGFFRVSNFVLLVLLGLIYDNFIIAIGRFIGEGELLENLSLARYWLHALFTPTLLLIAWSIYHRSQLPLSNKKIWKNTATLATLGLILYDFVRSVLGLELEANWRNDILTYENTNQSGSPLMVISVTLTLAAVGFLLMTKRKSPWLFIGTMLVCFGSICARWIKTFPIMNTAELLLMISIMVTLQYLSSLRTAK